MDLGQTNRRSSDLDRTEPRRWLAIRIPTNLNRFAYPLGVLDAINLTAAAPGIQAATGPGCWTAPDHLLTGVDGAGTSNAGGKATA